MKLIFCRECQDVVRLTTKWRKCDCEKSGGAYIIYKDVVLPIATVGGTCWTIGIPNPFFDEVFQYLTERGKEWYRKKHGYSGTDAWYGEWSNTGGDKQVFRVESPDGPPIKVKIDKLNEIDGAPGVWNVLVTSVDERVFTVDGISTNSVEIVSDFKPSFKGDKKPTQKKKK